MTNRTNHNWSDLALRSLCFVLCIPSVGALLAKVYGVASMQRAAIAVAMPSAFALLVLWWRDWNTPERTLATALEIGVVGGMLGTIGYDLARLPFALAGWRVFASISAFGLWLAEAHVSSRATEALGWAYHYFNGITFGIMYALVMARRHWIWAVMWGCLLETIALLSPFGRIFNFSGNYPAIAIAYFGHVGYGIPLGIVVQQWDSSLEVIRGTPSALKWMVAAVVAAALIGPTLSPERRKHDALPKADTFEVEGSFLRPEWIRIDRGRSVTVENRSPTAVLIDIKQSGQESTIPPGAAARFAFDRIGIFQVFVKTENRSHSSFVMVEPVEQR
jgi:hypothetical protein